MPENEAAGIEAGRIEAAGGTVHWVEIPGGIRVRAASFPAGARGVVLLLNGRAEFIEKHLETVRALQARDFAVWTLDWRGQGASSRLLADPVVHHVSDFGEYLGDAFALLDRCVVPGLAGRPLLLLGHSMGGHIGAHLLARRGALFAGAVLCAPMIDFLRGRWGPRWVVRSLVRVMCRVPGRAGRHAPGTRRLPDLERAFEGNRLTSCPDRHAAELALLRGSPEMAVGGASWAWLRAALASIVLLEDPRVLARIDMPVLVAMAGDERIVDNRAMRRFALRLKRGKLVRIPGARHELLREADPYRLAFWVAVDRFLAGVA